MSAWAGLGYYSRARNLHACAKAVVENFSGNMPSDEGLLQGLPGIGPYTAAAIASIAFGKQAAPVDGNIERVLSRLRAITKPLPASKHDIKAIATMLAPKVRAGDFAQAMMDLGATICTPKSPVCQSCPWSQSCLARKLGIAPDLPRRGAKRSRQTRRGVAFVLLTKDGRVLLRRRPQRGLLAGMHETPSSKFEKELPSDPFAYAPLVARFDKLPSIVHHTFTHFDLELDVYVTYVASSQAQTIEGEWAPLQKLARFAVPSVYRKVIEAAVAPQASLKPNRQSILPRQ